MSDSSLWFRRTWGRIVLFNKGYPMLTNVLSFYSKEIIHHRQHETKISLLGKRSDINREVGIPGERDLCSV